MATSTERVRAFRARQRAAIEADPDAARLRSADELLAPAVAETLAALDLKPEDAAAARLAVRYAEIIDAAREPAWAARWLMPLLLDTLERLNATPSARARMAKGQQAPRGPSQLDQLRQRRRQ